MGLSCLAVPQSDVALQSYNSIHSESKFSGSIGSLCPALPKSDAVLIQKYIPITPKSKFCDSIGLRVRSQPLIAAKRKIPTRDEPGDDDRSLKYNKNIPETFLDIEKTIR